MKSDANNIKEIMSGLVILNRLQAQANDSRSSEIQRVETLSADHMPHFDAGVTKFLCVGRQSIVKSKDDRDAANIIQVSQALLLL